MLRNTNYKFTNVPSDESFTKLAIRTCTKHTWHMLTSHSSQLWSLQDKQMVLAGRKHLSGDRTYTAT